MSLEQDLLRQLEAVHRGGREEYHQKLREEGKLFVRERPCWQGRRVASWAEIYA